MRRRGDGLSGLRVISRCTRGDADGSSATLFSVVRLRASFAIRTHCECSMSSCIPLPPTVLHLLSRRPSSSLLHNRSSIDESIFLQRVCVSVGQACESCLAPAPSSVGSADGSRVAIHYAPPHAAVPAALSSITSCTEEDGRRNTRVRPEMKRMPEHTAMDDGERRAKRCTPNEEKK